MNGDEELGDDEDDLPEQKDGHSDHVHGDNCHHEPVPEQKKANLDDLDKEAS